VQTKEAGATGWNPAGLWGLGAPEVSTAYSTGLVDDYFGYLDYALPLENGFVAGAGLLFYDAGNFALNSQAGTANVLAERDYLGTLTGAYQQEIFHQPCAIGANLKLLDSTLLNTYHADAVALDLGTTVEVPALAQNLRAGLALRNLGTAIKYKDSTDTLPTYALLGLGYDLPLAGSLAATFAGDAQFDLLNTWHGNVGVEVRMFDLLALRAGYQIGYALGSFTVGLGFQMNHIQLDYSFNPTDTLNPVHRLSLGYVFTQSPPAKNEAAANSMTATAAPGQGRSVLEENYPTEVEQTGPKTPVENIRANILEIQRSGGRAAKVIINVGSENLIKVGYHGMILDAVGRTVAGITIIKVNPKLSLAEVVSLGRDIDDDAIAVIERPVAK
jgi:hypothetical protein